MITLKALTLDECLASMIWRNSQIEMLRTSYLIPEGMQTKFYWDEICNKNSRHRYFGVHNGDIFIGMCGICNIEWENGLGEISLIFDEENNRELFGKETINLLLNQAFMVMRLENIYGECYDNSIDNFTFWMDVSRIYDGFTCRLRQRKFSKGFYCNSLYFSIAKENFLNANI